MGGLGNLNRFWKSILERRSGSLPFIQWYDIDRMIPSIFCTNNKLMIADCTLRGSKVSVVLPSDKAYVSLEFSQDKLYLDTFIVYVLYIFYFCSPRIFSRTVVKDDDDKE